MFRKIDDFGRLQLTITIDGERVAAEPGESVAAVLMRQSDVSCRTTPVLGSRRAPYCMMGVCFDCMAIVDGVASVQCCLVTVQEGMRVERQSGRRSVQS